VLVLVFAMAVAEDAGLSVVASAFVEKGYAATTILKRKECITS
jgi:hypothetical protein